MIRKSFTLIELLVVVAIIAVLIAILLPSLSEARNQARKMSCAANEKQIGLAMLMYVHDSFNWLPPAHLSASAPFNDILAGYLGSDEAGHGGKVIICPADPYDRVIYAGAPYETNPKRSYSVNTSLCPNRTSSIAMAIRVDDVEEPTLTIYMGEWHDPYNQCNRKSNVLIGYDTAYPPRSESPDRWPHRLQANFLFVDGHVSSYAPLDTVYPRNIWKPTNK